LNKEFIIYPTLVWR